MTTANDDIESTAVGEHNNTVDFLDDVGMANAKPTPDELSSTPPESAREAPKEAPEARTRPPQQNGTGPDGKKEINPEFKELRETGSWGNLSRSELHVVLGVIAMAVIAVVVLVVLVLAHVIGHKATQVDEEAILTSVRNGVRANNVTKLLYTGLPDNPGYYQDKGDGSAGYQAQAMSWLLYTDKHAHDSPVVNIVRYALAACYYAWAGPRWYNTTEWLSPDNHCTWNGILCDLNGNVTSIDLHSNNLVGTIPPELALVSSLISLGLMSNHLDGTLPADVLAGLPRIGIINVANNSLTGTIPNNLRSNDTSLTLSLFLNNLTGDFPYCYEVYIPELNEFQVDCLKVNCTCCDPHLNCFDG